MIKKFYILFLICMLCSCSSTRYREVSSREIREAEVVLQNAYKDEASVYASETYLEAQLKLRKAKSKMNYEKYKEAKSLAKKVQEIGNLASEQSQEERMRVKALAERLLFRGDEIWSRYERGDEKDYVPDLLFEIKKLLENGHRFLDENRFMDALDAAQESHQKLASLPGYVEKRRIVRLDEEQKKRMNKKASEEIIEEAKNKASKLIEDAKENVKKILLEAQVKGVRDRMEEFERIYPSTYRVIKGETIIDIAGRREIFNDPFMWPLIYKSNRDQIRDPKVLFPGQVLTIPRNIAFEEVIEARKQANASPPYIPPYDAYNSEFYRRYLLIAPEKAETPEDTKSNTSEKKQN